MRFESPVMMVGMPQLGPYGLSENWLLRHFGDIHWRLISESLGTRSADLFDEDGNRLYASFIRVTWTATRPLSAFCESDDFRSVTSILRHRTGIYVSTS